MYGGKTPFDGENPITFRNDKSFVTQKDGCTGKWDIVGHEETWSLEMKWDNENTNTKFEFLNLNPG